MDNIKSDDNDIDAEKLNNIINNPKNEEANPVKEINIGNYKYKFKDTLKKGYCYRCVNRASCKLTITIDKTEYKKIIQNINKENIKYTINSRQQEHTCIEKKTIQINKEKVRTQKEELNLAKTLIKANIDKAPSFHINNLHNNNINWSNNKIRNLVYRVQEEEYPSNKIFINYVQYAKVNLGEINTESNSYFICPKQIIFYNNKTKKHEHILYFTTPFQLNLLKETKMILVDGTFRSCPSNFYQILNIVGKIENKDISIPIVSVLMKSKSECSYINLLENLKLLIKENNIDIDFSKIYIMSDFEVALRNAIKNCFPDSVIVGCFFHYVKAIVNKFKQLGLLKKKIF